MTTPTTQIGCPCDSSHLTKRPRRTQGDAFKATARLGSAFARELTDKACGAANIAACLQICSFGALPQVKHAIEGFVGADITWLQRTGRFLGSYIKPTSYGRQIQFHSEFYRQAERVGCVMETLHNAAQINARVNSVTRGKISEIIDDDTVSDPELVAILLAAEYVEVKWKVKFNPATPGWFEKSNGEGTSCLMMTVKSDAYYKNVDTEYGGYHLVLLPTTTEDGNASSSVYGMVALPEQKGVSYVHSTMEHLATKGRELVTETLSSGPTDVTLSMPKISVQLRATSINQLIRNVGLGDIFNANSMSNLSVRCNGDAVDATITKVVHATYLKWDENGAVGAAVTAATVMRSVGSTLNVECVRPFACYLVDVATSNVEPTVLFSMCVADGSGFDMQHSSDGSDSPVPSYALNSYASLSNPRYAQGEPCPPSYRSIHDSSDADSSGEPCPPIYRDLPGNADNGSSYYRNMIPDDNRVPHYNNLIPDDGAPPRYTSLCSSTVCHK